MGHLLTDSFTKVSHQSHGINVHLNHVNSFAVLTLTNIGVVPGRVLFQEGQHLRMVAQIC